MSVKFPSNEETKLIFTVRTDGHNCSRLSDDEHGLVSYFRISYPNEGGSTKNFIEFNVEKDHDIHGAIYRSDRKRAKKVDIFLITTDNVVIRYRLNPLKLGSAKIMQKYRLPDDSKYIYIAGTYKNGGAHFEIGDTAKDCFTKLSKLRPRECQIFKISAEYCMRPNGIYGLQANPTNVEHKEIEKHLIECSKNPATYYDECMKYVPFELSFVEPYGTVSKSSWAIDWCSSKNAHMFSNPYWYTQMLTWECPHLWDFDDVEVNNPELIIDDTFGTIDDL